MSKFIPRSKLVKEMNRQHTMKIRKEMQGKVLPIETKDGTLNIPEAKYNELIKDQKEIESLKEKLNEISK